METATTMIERKRDVHLTLSETALEAAEAAGLDISRVLEEALRARTLAVRAEHWREENRDAVAWHNALVERMGGTLHEMLISEDGAHADNAV